MHLVRSRLNIVKHAEQALPSVVVAGEYAGDVDGLAGNGVEGKVGVGAHAEHYLLTAYLDAAVLGVIVGGGKLLATVGKLDFGHVYVEGHVVVFVLAVVKPLSTKFEYGDGCSIGCAHELDVLLEHALVHTTYGAVVEGAYLGHGYYYIKNQQYETNLLFEDNAWGANVFSGKIKHGMYARWYIKLDETTAYGEKFYTITPNNSDEYDLACATSDSYANNGNITVGYAAHKWRIVQNADGSYRIMPSNTTLQSITTDNSGAYNAYTYEYYGWPSMKWEFEELTEGIGNAPELTMISDSSINCFGYAIGVDHWVELYTVDTDTLDEVAQHAINSAWREGVTIYKIESYDAPIMHDEYRICMRTGDHNDEYDVHFMKQVYELVDGNKVAKWADKISSLPMTTDRNVRTEDPSTIKWPAWGEVLFWEIKLYENFYDSDTVFFAVKRS